MPRNACGCVEWHRAWWGCHSHVGAVTPMSGLSLTHRLLSYTVDVLGSLGRTLPLPTASRELSLSQLVSLMSSRPGGRGRVWMRGIRLQGMGETGELWNKEVGLM